MANMNVNKLVKNLLVAAMIIVSGSAVAKSAGIDYQKEIAKLGSAVDGARKAGQINHSEQTSLKKELAEIRKLYLQYSKDQNITPQEAKALKIKLKKSDLNLFRKKYD